MIYPIHSSAIIDVTKPPYCADHTGKTDCTAILKQILDDLLLREINGVQKEYDKLIQMSEGGTKIVYDGFENRVKSRGRVNVLYPELVPDSQIIYFPAGRYLVSDTITYSLENLKNIYDSKPLSELCRCIHIMGESAEGTVIQLADGSPGFEAGKNKPVLSFVNVPDCMERKCSNVCQNNTLEDITIDCGQGNPGAVGVRFTSINTGKLENVTLLGHGAWCGLECAVNTTASIVGLSASGFAYGIHAPYSSVTVIDQACLSDNRRSAIKTTGSKLVCKQIASGAIPTLEFYQTDRSDDVEELGVYYLADQSMTYCGEIGSNRVYFGTEEVRREACRIPKNARSTNAEDWVCVDDFGAKGDGVTDSTEAIQRALNSGMPVVIFGSGHYLVSGVMQIPKSVKTLDFMYCDLFSSDELIGLKNGGVFEINEASTELLFVENLYTFEQFYGHFRLIKQNAERDLVLRNIHNQASATYFNTVGGSRIYLDNCASTTATYVHNCVLTKDVPYEDYSGVIPYEFHSQRVYGMQVNPERGQTELLNDGSELVIDAYKIEGPGVAVKTVNGGKTEIHICLAAIGYVEADNAMYDTENGMLSLCGLIVRDAPFWGKLRYQYLFDTAEHGVTRRVHIEEVQDRNCSDKRVNRFESRDFSWE